MNKNFENKFVIDRIFKFCIATGCRFLFISGNGGAGKSTISKKIKEKFVQNGFTANLIDTDDFVTNSAVRRSAKSVYLDSEGNENFGSFSTSFEESYCLNSLKAAIFNLRQKLDFFHIPKRCQDESDYVLLSGNADIHIFEGVGTQFIEKPKDCLSVYVGCDLDIEAKRRIARARNGEEKQTFEQVLAKCKERRDKLEEMSIVKSVKFDLILKSNEDFSFVIEKDVFNVVESEDMNKDCEFSIKVIKQASALLINDFETVDKGDSGDVVTSLEINIEKYIIKKVKESYPNFDIISEEFSPDVKISKNCVIINGIDGSVNVSKMMPIFATQMAIIRDGICTAAVTYLPFLNELYFADEDNAYLNGKKRL